MSTRSGLLDRHIAFLEALRAAGIWARASEALRAAGQEAPIVMLSSNTGFAEQDPAARHLHAILQKPVPRARLFEVLSGVTEAPLVAAPPSLPKLPPPPAAEKPEPEPPEAVRLRVLAAEDNRTNQFVFRKMVKSLPVDLHFANNGVEAVALFRELRPDIVFMDISMPEMDGKAATLEIRKLEEGGGHRTPIIACTAHAMTGDREALIAAGLDPQPVQDLDGAQALFLPDPDGLRIELTWYPPGVDVVG